MSITWVSFHVYCLTKAAITKFPTQWKGLPEEKCVYSYEYIYLEFEESAVFYENAIF